MTDTQYILLDDENGTYEVFESEEELEEYITDEYSEESVEYLRVFEVEKEYSVSLDTEVTLEEV